MKIVGKILSVLLIALALKSFSQDNPGLTFGGFDNDMGYSLCETAEGGYVIAGNTRSEGAGSSDMFIVNITREGKQKWSRVYGWQHDDHLTSVITSPNGYTLFGHVWDYGFARLDMYLLNTDLAGNRIYDKMYGTNWDDLGLRIKPAFDGGHIMIGYSRGYDDAGNIVLLKTDESGNEQWRNDFGTEYDDVAFDFYHDDDGTNLIFCSFETFYFGVHYNFVTPSANWALIKTDEVGNELWRKVFETDGHDHAQAILPAADGGYYLFGSSLTFGAGSYDMLLIKINKDGNKEWYKTFGGESYEYGLSMAINDEGDLYLFGTTKSYGANGSADYFIVKTDPMGEKLWSLALGGDDNDIGNKVIATSDSGCAVIGQSRSFGEGGFDMLFVKLDKNGIVEQLVGGIDTLPEDEIVVYPNPVRSYGQFSLSTNVGEYSMEIISATGNVINTYTLSPPDYRFNVETLAKGFYIYRVTKKDDSSFKLTGKLLVQ